MQKAQIVQEAIERIQRWENAPAENELRLNVRPHVLEQEITCAVAKMINTIAGEIRTWHDALPDAAASEKIQLQHVMRLLKEINR